MGTWLNINVWVLYCLIYFWILQTKLGDLRHHPCLYWALCLWNSAIRSRQKAFFASVPTMRKFINVINLRFQKCHVQLLIQMRMRWKIDFQKKTLRNATCLCIKKLMLIRLLSLKPDGAWVGLFSKLEKFMSGKIDGNLLN